MLFTIKDEQKNGAVTDSYFDLLDVFDTMQLTLRNTGKNKNL